MILIFFIKVTDDITKTLSAYKYRQAESIMSDASKNLFFVAY
jgi:hypothetical protein